MIEIEDRELDVLLAQDPGGSVVMLNLLRFRPDGGRALVAETGQDWDMVVLVRYPSRTAFADMVRSSEYAALAHLRNEALVETVLQPTAPVTVG